MAFRDEVARFDRRGADTAQGPDERRDDDPRDAAFDEVRRAWEDLPASLFGGQEERARALETFAGVGLFRGLAGARRAGQRVDALAAVALSTPEVRAIKGHRAILEAWIAPLRRAAARPAEEEIEEDAESEPEPGDEARYVSFERVRAQQEAIVGAMRHKHLGRARQMIEELCAYQRRGRPIYLAKSLCHLAAEAQRLGLHQLQDELTDRATRVCPDDAWSWSQRGSALQRLGELSGAIAAYDRALLLGGDAAAKNGRADVLKATGRLDEALQAYEQTIREHPDNVYATRGRADVLKVMGRLDEALTTYERLLVQDAGDAFAKTGRAVVFKMQGRLDEALRAYDAAIREHPDNAVAKAGRAEVLKALGRFDDALRAYDDACRAHAESVVAKSGRAELLKEAGRLDEALDAYEQILREHPAEIVPRSARADVLLWLGRHRHAFDAYDAILRDHPTNDAAKLGRARVWKAEGRLDAALQAYEAILAEQPASRSAQRGRADVLRAAGRLDEALAVYNGILHDHPADLIAVVGRACTLALLGRSREALRALPHGSPASEAHWAAYHARGLILLRAGRVDEAASVCEDGRQNDPVLLRGDAYRVALAVAHLRGRRPAAALEVLAEVRQPRFQAHVDMLRIHAFGALGRSGEARAAYLLFPPAAGAPGRDLADELRRRFVDQAPAEHDDEWLIRRQIEACLLSA